MILTSNIVTLDQPTHTYRDEHGRTFVSVTTLISRLFPFDRDAVADRVASNKVWADKQDARAIKDDWAQSAVDGQELHEAIETWVNTGAVPPPDCRTFAAVNFLATVAKWKGPLRSEVVVWDSVYLIAGTIDLIENCGAYDKLWDIKTCRTIDYEKLLKYSIQLNLYLSMYSVQHERKVMLGGVIWFENWRANPTAKPKIRETVPCWEEQRLIMIGRAAEVAQ